MEQTTQNNSEEEINIHEIITILWKHKFIIAFTMLVGIIGAGIYAFTAPEEYSSTTLFVTKTSSGGSSSLSGLASLAGISIGNQSNMDPSSYLDKIVQDEEFLLPVLQKKWFYKGDSLYLDQILKLKPDTTMENWQYFFKVQKINMLRQGMISVVNEKAGALKTSGVMSLTVNMPDAQLSYDVNNFTLQLIRDYLRNSMTGQAKEKRVFIEERIAETKPLLEASENALAKFRERNQITSSPDLVLTEMRLTRDLNINQELYLQYKKQYELARIDEKNDQPLLQVLKNPEVPLYKNKPKRRLIILGGLFAGLILGCLLSLLIDRVKRGRAAVN